MRTLLKIAAVLLFSAAGLLAQISNPEPTVFLTKDDNGLDILMPRDTKVGFSLDLPYYFNRNVVQLMAASRDDNTDYTNWTNLSAGVHTDNANTYLTDWQSITITIPSGGQDDGATLDITNYDFTHFADGDTCVAADYLLISIYILSQDSTDLGSSKLQLIFGYDTAQTLTNYYKYEIAATSLTNGWNYFKVAKSGFTSVGSPNWNSIKFVCVKNNGTATSAEVVFSFDYIALVKDDPDAAEPNPFQSEGPDGTWTADWTQERAGNVWIVEESGVLGVRVPDGATLSYLIYGSTFGNYKTSGVTKAGTIVSGSILFSWGYTKYFYATASTIYLTGTSTSSTTGFTAANGDLIYWKFEKKGTSITGSASLDGHNWTSVSEVCDASAIPAIHLQHDGQRLYSLGLSSVAYAAESGMAYRVEYLFYRNDTLFVKHAGTTGDSLAAIAPDVMLKE